MTEKQLSLEAWRQQRSAICAAMAGAVHDERRLLTLARELVAWEALRPTGNGRRLQRVLHVWFDGFEFSHHINHTVLAQMLPRQHGRLLWYLENISLWIWKGYAR